MEEIGKLKLENGEEIVPLMLHANVAEALEPGVDWFSFKGKDSEHAFMDAPEGFVANETLERFDSKSKFTHGGRALATQPA